LPSFVRDPRKGAGPFPRYSVCFPTYNAIGLIEPLLASLEAQVGEVDFELVVCDDCSTDATAELLEAHPQVRLVRTEVNSGPSVARNTAACAARAEILIFLDADVVLREDTLQQIETFLTERPDCGAFHWAMSADVLSGGPVGLYKTLLDVHMTRVSGRTGTHPTTFWSCRAGMIRREHFFAAGGFDPRYRKADIEDWEFSRRISQQTEILHTDRFTIHHHQSPSFRTNLHNYFRRSFLFLRLLARHKQLDNYTETTPLNSLATVATLPGVVCLLVAAALTWLGRPDFARFALAAGAALLLLFSLVNARFFLYCVRQRGLQLLPLVVGLRLVYSLAVACGVGLALLLWPLRGWPFEVRG